MPEQVAIHPTAYVVPDVEIGPGTVIGPYAVILAPTRIGRDCWIGPHVVIGTTGEHVDDMVVHRIPPDAESLSPEELEAALWHGSHGEGIEIGDRTIIREHTVVQQGTHRPTVVGSDCFVMDKVHIAHDCVIGDRVRITPFVSFGGHVTVGDDANLGMTTAIHQWRTIGAGVMVGMNTTITRDAAPYTIQMGSPNRATGVNRVLLERAGHPPEEIEALAEALRDGTEPPAAFAPAFERWEAERRP